MAGRPNNSDAIQAHIRGMREAKAQHQAIEPTLRERGADATEMTVRMIARGAQSRLLSSPSVQTRNLYNAVGWKMNRNNGRGRAGITNQTTSIRIGGKTIRVKGIITAGTGGSAKTSQGAKIDRPARRAHLTEFGTRHSKAEPFMGPAAAAEKNDHIARCKAAGRLAEQDLARSARTV